MFVQMLIQEEMLRCHPNSDIMRFAGDLASKRYQDHSKEKILLWKKIMPKQLPVSKIR
jgi:hypothetical protein